MKNKIENDFENLLKIISENQANMNKFYLGKGLDNKFIAEVFFTNQSKTQIKLISENKKLSISKFELLYNNLKNIISLEIIDSNLENPEAILLASILPSTKIMSLDLSNNRLGKEGIEAIADTLKNTRVKSLTLNGHQLCNNLTESFFSNLEDSKVIELSISNYPIEEKTINLLASFLENSLLNILSLDHTGIYDTELEVLIRVLPDTKIRELNVVGNNISEQAINQVNQIIQHNTINIGESFDFDAT